MVTQSGVIGRLPRMRWRHTGAALLAFVGVNTAQAYGPAGHRIAGRVAEARLCPAAVAQVEALTGTTSLAVLGEWADRIRDDPGWRHTADWHYLNVPDGASSVISGPPTAGRLDWAVQHFGAQLTDARKPLEARATALRFFVHFVVDAHQPLHVGRPADRGGNAIALSVARRRTTLHQFWDSGVIRTSGLSDRAYAAALDRLPVLAGQVWLQDPPRQWLEESFALRSAVYAFDPGAGSLDTAYRQKAQIITRQRLAQAGARLAAQLNLRFCGAP